MLAGFTNVTFEFGARTIVEDATWHIQPGERIGLIGYNGTGKSKTLAKITLSWTDVANNTSYTLERCKVSGKGNSATCTFSGFGAVLGQDANSYVDTGVAALGPGTYRYRLSAGNAAGSSGWTQISVTAN